MSSYFTPSINIIRDSERELDYLVTPNAKRVFRIIKDNFLAGNRAFSLLGTYGTGKSSFLMALERHLQGDESYFEEYLDEDFETAYDFIKIVGSYQSCITSVADELKVKSSLSNPVGAIIEKLKERLSEDACTILVIDEFGKFLEYAGKNDPEKELYFIQQLAEFVSAPENRAMLLVTLHQGFDGYAAGLDQQQKNEWEKVKGRLTEISFNEPLEQLLFIASERIPEENAVDPKTAVKVFRDAREHHIIKWADRKIADLAKSLRPLDTVAAYAIAASMQRYGQNERSLFTFLEAEAHLGLKSFREEEKNKGKFYHLGCVYEYLIFNYYTVLYSPFNPDYFKWTIIKDTLDRVESQVDETDQIGATALVKTIGLLSIFSSKGAKINQAFLLLYAEKVLEIEDANELLGKLESLQLIRYLRFRDSYILFEGTDFDIEGELNAAAKHVSAVKDLVPRLNKHFQLPYIPAKKYFYQKGTPRYFRFVLSETPITELRKDEVEVDGYINLIFGGDLPQKSHDDSKSILYGKYADTDKLKTILREMDIVDAVRKRIIDDQDQIAKREVGRLKVDLINQLNTAILDVVLQTPSKIDWVHQAKGIEILTPTIFYQTISEICEVAYPDTPVYRNELVNKTKLSAAVSTARKRLFSAMVDRWQEKDFGFPESKYPAEKSIYLTLFRHNLHVKNEAGQYEFVDFPHNESFQALWESGEAFLKSARDNKRNLRELVEMWRSAPFRLKKGFLDYWLPIFLFIKRNDYSLYNEKQHLVPYITVEVLEYFIKYPQRFSVKSFELAGQRLNIFNKYRELTQQNAQERVSQEGFLETVKPFLVFFKSLPAYSQKTNQLSSDTLAFRKALLKARDPEKAFFEDFPTALGYSLQELEEDDEKLTLFAQRVRDCIRELREAFRDLVNRIEADILKRRGIETKGYPAYVKALSEPFQELKVHLMRPEQKVFHQRLQLEMDDHETWISAVCQVILKKQLETITDDEVPYLLDKLGDAFRGLDNLRKFNNFDSIGEDEEVIRLELTSLSKGLEQQTFSNIAKINPNDIKGLKEKWKKLLTNNKDTNIAALSEMLKELLSGDE